LNDASKALLGKKINPHDFRHSILTEAGKSNTSIKDVMNITGHEDISVVLKHYQHSTDEGRMKVLGLTRV